MPQVLEFAISIVVIFFMLSMIVSSITEFWNSKVGQNYRARFLYQVLLKVLNDEQNRNFTEPLYRHPLVEKSKPNQNDLPSYIDPRIMATVLIEIVNRHYQPYKIHYDEEGKPLVSETEFSERNTFSLFVESVNGLHTSDLKILLQSFLHHTHNLEELKTEIESWYKAYMDRVTGWFKRSLKRSLFIVGLIVSITLNADFFRIVKSAWNDTTLRKELVQVSYALRTDAGQDTPGISYGVFADKLDAQVDINTFPIGWKGNVPVQYREKKTDSGEGFRELVIFNWDYYLSWSTVLGWFIMAFALHLGAQFWFEALIKLINIRGAGVKPS